MPEFGLLQCKTMERAAGDYKASLPAQHFDRGAQGFLCLFQQVGVLLSLAAP